MIRTGFLVVLMCAAVGSLSHAVQDDLDGMVSVLRRLPEQREVTLGEVPESVQTLIQRIVHENVPHHYQDDKDWGRQKKRWDGLSIRREGLQIKTKRKWKEVNHGTWRRYEIRQLDPEDNLRVRIENLHDAGSGSVGFEVALMSKMRAFARVAKWRKGVQLYSLSLDADVDVELSIDCQMAMRLDPTKFPPDLIVHPTVDKADLQVTDFRVRKISKLRGALARELGETLHRVVLRKIEDKRDKLPDKINRQISKNNGKLRFSPSDFAVERWSAFTDGMGELDNPPNDDSSDMAGLDVSEDDKTADDSGPLLLAPGNSR